MQGGCTPQRKLLTERTAEHSYIYAGGKLLRETITETGKDKTVTTYTLDFRYDAQGAPYSLIVTTQGVSQTYYYITNLQGDVMYMVDAVGNQVAEYEYDPYGKIIRVVDATANASSSNGEDGTEDVQPYANIPTELEDTTKTLAELNPLRYRGYYYDTETSFYYLQSRYYDPTICRFINADGYASTGQGLVGYNMFAYCLNNPIICVDSEGRMAEAAILVTNYWNPLGWAVVAVLTVECVVVAAEVVTYAFETYSIALTAEETEVLTSVTSVAITGVAQPPNNDDKKPSFKKVSKHLLKKLGLDAHEIKREYLGKNAQISHYDLSYDTKTGIVYILTKAGEIVAKTYYNVFIDRPPLR